MVCCPHQQYSSEAAAVKRVLQQFAFCGCLGCRKHPRPQALRPSGGDCLSRMTERHLSCTCSLFCATINLGPSRYATVLVTAHLKCILACFNPFLVWMGVWLWQWTLWYCHS